jgi:hypothetical protein
MISNLDLLPNDQMTQSLFSKAFSPAQDGNIGFSVHAKWVGTPNGVLKIQSSNDPTDPDVWCDVPDSALSIAGSAGSNMYNVTSCYYKFVRVAYVFSSGTGTLTLNRNQGGI